MRSFIYINMACLLAKNQNPISSMLFSFFEYINLLLQFMNPITPTSEIAPAKPPRPAPQAQHPPELPQKGSRKLAASPDVQQRSSTESSGSDGTEPVEQVMS